MLQPKLNVAETTIDFILPSLDLLLSSLDSFGFSRISDRIKVLWGTRECSDYLRELVLDTRGRRKGFPVEVFETILEIYNLHYDIFYSDIAQESPDIWSIF